MSARAWRCWWRPPRGVCCTTPVLPTARTMTPAHGCWRPICGLAASRICRRWWCRIATPIIPVAPCRCCVSCRWTGWLRRWRQLTRWCAQRRVILAAAAASNGSGAASASSGCTRGRTLPVPARTAPMHAAACCGSSRRRALSCWPVTSNRPRKAGCWRCTVPVRCKPMCCSHRITAAPPRRRRPSWRRWRRPGRSSRSAIATASAIRRRECCSATSRPASASCAATTRERSPCGCGRVMRR